MRSVFASPPTERGRPIKRLVRGETSSEALVRTTSVRLLAQQVLIKGEKSRVDRGDPNEHQELVLKSDVCVFLNKLTRASVSGSFCLRHTMTEGVTVSAAAHFPAVCVCGFYFRALEHRQFGFSGCVCVYGHESREVSRHRCVTSSVWSKRRPTMPGQRTRWGVFCSCCTVPSPCLFLPQHATCISVYNGVSYTRCSIAPIGAQRSGVNSTHLGFLFRL